MYRQSLIDAGGVAPSSTSRTMPPEVAAATESTRTPKRSSRCRTAIIPPLNAKTNVPPRSSPNSNGPISACISFRPGEETENHSGGTLSTQAEEISALVIDDHEKRAIRRLRHIADPPAHEHPLLDTHSSLSVQLQSNQ